MLGKLIKLLKFKPAEPDLVHPFFGPLMGEVVGDDNDYWEGGIIFKPLSIEISLGINESYDGPKQEQVEFYKWFENNYESEFKRISTSLISKYEEWFGDKPKGTFTENFEFSRLEIPQYGDINNPWSVSFECLTDKHQHLYTASLTNNKVTEVSVDG